MSSTHDHHHEAMRLAEEADRLRKQGDLQAAARQFRLAFERERQAAESTPLQQEPTRSVLHRSAATLALECSEYREAERLIAAALSGDPPDVIADELRDLLERVYFDPPPRQKRREFRPLAPVKGDR
jgi:hypothetical protein